MPNIGRRAFVAGSAAALFAKAIPASAQEYPARPITLIIPFPPGGSTTIVIRSVSDKLGEALGQQIVIDNRAGAGGTVGTRALAKSDPDGYTIGLGYTGTLAIGPNLYSNVGYDPRKDFSSIGRIATAPNTLVVHPSFPAKSVQELIAYAKANPGKVSYGSAGIGTVSHVCGEYFASATGIKLVHIPYKGTGPALQDVIGGHIPMAFAPIPATYSNAKAGTMRMLGGHQPRRARRLRPKCRPSPSRACRGSTQCCVTLWLRLPARRARSSTSSTRRSTPRSPPTRCKKRLALEGAEPVTGTPDQYAADLDKEITLWAKVVKESGAKAD